MKKLLTISISAFALSLLPAKAELLYFMAESFSWEGPKYNFDYVRLGVATKENDEWTTGSIYLPIVTESGTPIGAYVDAVKSGSYTYAGPAWADISGYTTGDYMFYIETSGDGTFSSQQNAGKVIWGFSEETAQTYAQLLKGNHIYTDDTSAQDVTPWSIPEPSSGMLLVLGLAGLALRRRRSRGERPAA